MSNELENAVAQFILKTTQAAEAAGKFAVEQLPDVAQQYVLYRGGWALLENAFILLSLIVLVAWVCKVYKELKELKEEEDISEGQGFLLFLGTAAILAWFGFGLFKIVANAKIAFLAFYAPKILLIQWAASLVK
jgi:hypothetical protein